MSYCVSLGAVASAFHQALVLTSKAGSCCTVDCSWKDTRVIVACRPIPSLARWRSLAWRMEQHEASSRSGMPHQRDSPGRDSWRGTKMPNCTRRCSMWRTRIRLAQWEKLETAVLGASSTCWACDASSVVPATIWLRWSRNDSPLVQRRPRVLGRGMIGCVAAVPALRTSRTTDKHRSGRSLVWDPSCAWAVAVEIPNR